MVHGFFTHSLPLLASSVQLQEEVNSQSIEVLTNYVESFQKCMESGGKGNHPAAIMREALYVDDKPGVPDPWSAFGMLCS